MLGRFSMSFVVEDIIVLRERRIRRYRNLSGVIRDGFRVSFFVEGMFESEDGGSESLLVRGGGGGVFR